MTIKSKLIIYFLCVSVLFSVANADTGNSSTYKLAVQENNFAGNGNSTTYNISVDSGSSGIGNSSTYRINLGLVTFLATFGSNVTTTASPLVNFTSLAGDSTVSQGTTFHVQISLSNTGNTNSTIIPRLYIFDSSNNLVFQRTGSSATLAAGTNVSLFQYNTLVFSVGSTAAGTYNATVSIQFTDENGATQFTQNKSIIFQIQATSSGSGTTSAGGGGATGGTQAPPPPPEENTTQEQESTDLGIVEFRRLPLVLDMSSGQEYTEIISIKNLKTGKIENISISITGVPEEWISISEPSFSMEANAEKDIAVTFSIPSGAETKNYQARFLVQNTGILNDQSLLLRVMSGQLTGIQGDTGRSSGNFEVRQNIVVDLIKKRTDITISLKNGYRFKNNLSYIRTINKTVAASVNEITFINQPTRVINPDPVVEWVFYNVSPYQENNISYFVDKIAAPEFLINQPQEIIFYLSNEQNIQAGTEFSILNIIVILAAVIGGIFAYRFIHSRSTVHYPRGFKRFIGKPILGSESGKTLGLVADITFVPETGEILDIKIKNPTPYAQKLMRTSSHKNDMYVPFQSLKGAHDYVVVTERDIVKNLKWYKEFRES